MTREVSAAEYSRIELAQGEAGTRGRDTVPRASTEDVWRELGKASFAIVSHVTPAGEPRSSGVVYGVHERHLYAVVAVRNPAVARGHVPIA
jgi:hypothetical protein